MKKNAGVILMLLGVLLTINQNEYDIQLIKEIQKYAAAYWPLIFSFIGVYLVSTPKKRKK